MWSNITAEPLFAWRAANCRGERPAGMMRARQVLGFETIACEAASWSVIGKFSFFSVKKITLAANVGRYVL